MKKAGPGKDDAESSVARSGTEFVGMVPIRSEPGAGLLLGPCLFVAIWSPDA